MFKWPFATRGVSRKTQGRSVSPPGANIEFAVFANNDAYIKVWLPDKLTQALDNLSVSHRVSRPDALRSVLFRHVYGVVTFEGFAQWKAEAAAQEAALTRESGVKFSRERSSSIEFIGKSTENLKLWLPAALKNELALLAKADRLGISDYVRKVLVKEFLGERYYQDWQRYIGEVPAEALAEEAS